MAGQGSGGNVIAAICSFFIPGLGQLVQGRVIPAILFFIVISLCYVGWVIVFPGIIGLFIHLWCIINAARYQPEGELG